MSTIYPRLLLSIYDSSIDFLMFPKYQITPSLLFGWERLRTYSTDRVKEIDTTDFLHLPRKAVYMRYLCPFIIIAFLLSFFFLTGEKMGRGRLCYRKVTDKILFILQKHNPTLKNESSFVFVISFLSFFFLVVCFKKKHGYTRNVFRFLYFPSTVLTAV